jgi:chromosome segregation ATPase
MSTQTITTTRNSSPNTISPDPSSHLAIQALSQTEQMNQEVIREMNASLKTFKDLFAEMQKTLGVTLEKNALLEKQILQLNNKIKENEKLHTAEMKKNTQTIATLSNSVTSLTSDLSSTNRRLRNQERNFGTLADKFNSHNHTLGLNFQGGWQMTNYTSSGPSTPYKT